jgi:tRNA (adenine22-N1)-methyltransferase
MKRIEALSKHTKGIHTLLDIGTDHGYLLIDALHHGYIKKGIAADINLSPLKNAEKNIKAAGLDHLVEFKLSDGFLQIDIDYDGVLIAGMGMHLVKSILLQPHKRPLKYIVSVHTHIDQFRAFLSESGFMIIDETVVFERFYYVIFTLIYKQDTLSEKDIYLGPLLQHKKEAVPYYRHLLSINEKIMEVAPVKKRKLLEIQSNWLQDTINRFI